jgi:hypothetical protein
MSYDQVTPTFYQTFQPHTPFHAGGPGWTKSPWVTWGNNPNLAGRRTLATDGLGGCGCAGASGLGNVLAISGLGATNLVPTLAPPVPPAPGVPMRAATAMPLLPPMPPFPDIPEQPAWRKALGMVAGAACAYHGFKRNESAGWAVAWAAFGSGAPFLALPIALAQGFGKPARKAAMAANRRRGRSRRR